MRFPRPGVASDQYHAFTARLSASGYQRTSMRVVAGCILALGLPALLAALAPRATPWPAGRAAFGVIAVACVALAVPWLRYRWPTRGESAAVVVLGTVALTVGALVTSDPLAGLLTAVAFPFILGYTALFHSARLLGFSIGGAAVTIVWLAIRVALNEVPTALAVTTPLILLCVLVTFACRTIADVGGSAEPHHEIDPLTGLLTRESFYERASTMLGARHREDDRYLVLAVIDIDGLGAIGSLQGARGTNQAQVAAGQALRDTTRQEAVLGRLTGDDSAAAFLLAEIFTIPDPSPLIERVRGAVAATPTGITASIGVVSTALRPLTDRPPHEVLDEVISIATAASAQARGRGGNQACYRMDPELQSGRKPDEHG